MLKIRNIKDSDLKSIAAIHVECWKKAYQGLLPQNYLDALDISSRQKKWEIGMQVNADVVRLVALEKSQPVGFIVGLENRTPEKCPESNGEVWALYIHPDHWEKGYGRMLFHEFQEVMKVRGMEKIFLWVLASNKRGRAFYEAMGGELYPATQELDINGEKFSEVSYLFRS